MMVLLMGSLGCGSAEGDVSTTATSGDQGSDEPMRGAAPDDGTRDGEGHGMRQGRRRGHGMRGGRGGGHGMRGGRGGHHGMGGGGGGAPAEIRDTLHALLDHHAQIVRSVEERDDGIASVTTSEDPEVVALLRRHVREIAAHVEGGGGIRRWDPLFEALGEHYEEMTMEIRDVPGGVAVIHRGTTPAAVELIRAHARVVSGFAEHGYDEAQREHPRP